MPIDRVGGVSPLPPSAPRPQHPGPSSAGGTGAPSFGDQLQQQQAAQGNGGVQFSKHALERVQRRGIDANPATMRRLSHGVDLAAGKNARNAVVMVDDTAFVVAVPNRTVVTAIDAAHMRQHVFTNIDSAVVA